MMVDWFWRGYTTLSWCGFLQLIRGILTNKPTLHGMGRDSLYCKKLVDPVDPSQLAGWWFGTWRLFLHILGMSSSNWGTHISQRGRVQPPTSKSISYEILHTNQTLLLPGVHDSWFPDVACHIKNVYLKIIQSAKPVPKKAFVKTAENINWLVVWNIFYFPIELGIIIPFDFHIFQRGRLNHQAVMVIWLRVIVKT